MYGVGAAAAAADCHKHSKTLLPSSKLLQVDFDGGGSGGFLLLFCLVFLLFCFVFSQGLTV